MKFSKKSLVGEINATRWVNEWFKTIKKHPDIPHDEDTMLGWFANAIMAGYDEVDKKHEKRLQNLRDACKVQCANGNWNYSEYMHGMANGLILAVSIFEGTNPEYKEAPKEWLKDKPFESVIAEDKSIVKSK